MYVPASVIARPKVTKITQLRFYFTLISWGPIQVRIELISFRNNFVIPAKSQINHYHPFTTSFSITSSTYASHSTPRITICWWGKEEATVGAGGHVGGGSWCWWSHRRRQLVGCHAGSGTRGKERKKEEKVEGE